LNKYKYQLDDMLELTCEDSADVADLKRASASGDGTYTDPFLFGKLLTDTFTDRLLQLTDTLNVKDAAPGQETSNKAMVREGITKVVEILDGYQLANRKSYAQTCYNGSMHWYRLLDPSSCTQDELNATSTWFDTRLAKVSLITGQAVGNSDVKDEVEESGSGCDPEYEEDPELPNIENHLLRSKVARHAIVSCECSHRAKLGFGAFGGIGAEFGQTCSSD